MNHLIVFIKNLMRRELIEVYHNDCSDRVIVSRNFIQRLYQSKDFASCWEMITYLQNKKMMWEAYRVLFEKQNIRKTATKINK